MSRLGPLRLSPSRLARRLRLFATPAAVLVLLYAAWLAQSPQPLYFIPGILIVAAVAARSWDRVRGLELRSDTLLLDTGDGRYEAVLPCGEPRISALAISLPCRLASGRRRLRLNVWCDAVDPASYRRIARMVRHGRWPASGQAKADATAPS